MRLLLVEDSLRLQKLLADALRRASYEVDVVATVAELLNSIAVVQYDLIIVDLGLPDGDGLGASRTLRSRGHSTPILIMTARGQYRGSSHWSRQWRRRLPYQAVQ